MTESITVQLSKPIEHDGNIISSLVFRESTVGDMCNADLVAGEFQKLVSVLAGMSGTTLPFMKLLTARDFAKITEAVKDLMGESTATTGTPSSH